MHRGSGRIRVAAGIVLGSLAVVIGAATVPVDATLASFTDIETAVASPSITAGTLGSASIKGCSISGSQIRLTWTSTPGTIAGDKVLVRFTAVTNGAVLDFPVAASVQSTQISANGNGFRNNRDYRVSVVTQLSSAPSWTSLAGTTAVFRKGSNGNNNSNSCA